MSYNVNGTVYHDFNQYQAARREADLTRVQQEASSARVESQRLQEKLRSRELELESARGDLQEQRRLAEAIQRDVAALSRAQSRLAQAQTSMEREMEQQFADTRAHMEAHGEQLDQLRQNHQRHQEEVRRRFSEAREELETGLAEAEQRRKETEARLERSIQTVADEVEADRRARLERITSREERARRALEEGKESLERLDQRECERLGVEEQRIRLEEELKSARRLLDQEDTSAALAASWAVLTSMRTLERVLVEHRAHLESARLDVTERVGWLRESLKGEEIEGWFPVERHQVTAFLERIVSEAVHRYVRYADLPHTRQRHDDALRVLEREVDRWRVLAPLLEGDQGNLYERLPPLIQSFTRVYGPVQNMRDRLENPKDPKSSMVVELDFGGPQIYLYCSLDGSIRVEGFGHLSNTQCSHKAQEILQQPFFNARTLQMNGQNPQAPMEHAREVKDTQNVLRRLLEGGG